MIHEGLDPNNLTPMLQQYYALKEQVPGAILLFRLGDFYEMFAEDASLAARELEITLTSREAGKGVRIPMCGVPHHAAEGYISTLVQKGYRVAICEQMEDPKEAKGCVRRDVVRVVTPGTLTEGLDFSDREHLIVAILGDGEAYGLAQADVSTGSFRVTEFRGERAWEQLRSELLRLGPAETLRPEGWEAQLPGLITPYKGLDLPLAEARRQLCTALGTLSLEATGCQEMPWGVRAAAGLWSYLRETQKVALGHLRKIQTYHLDEFMFLDTTTRRNLELTETLREGKKKGSLLGVLDRTKTAMGARKLRNWLQQPLLSPERIEARLELVQALVDDGLIRLSLAESLNQVYDLERLMGRVGFGSANARDLNALALSLRQVPQILEAISPLLSGWEGLRASLDPMEDIVCEIEHALREDPPVSVREGGMIRSEYNGELDALRSVTSEGKDWIANLEGRERERLGIRSLKVGFNKVFGYYIEITTPNLHLVPDTYQRKQTLANAERFVTPELKEWESRILGAEEKLVELEYRIFVELREKVAREMERIRQTADTLAVTDTLFSLATVAVEQNYTRPIIDQGQEILIRGGRHPVVERSLSGSLFVPNDAQLGDEDCRLIILTGPNMAGKSTYMRQLALIVLMAQVGSFVPAERAQIGVVDRIFTRVGAADDLATGQSTFMVEMNELGYILSHATDRSLVLLDEVGRGTATYDGLSLAWAVTEYLRSKAGPNPKTIFATHYHELCALAQRLPGVKNFSVAVRQSGEEIVFLRRIVPGGADRSYGIEVARLAGLPKGVIDRAKEILAKLEDGKPVTPTARAQKSQLNLFSPDPDPLIHELAQIDCLTLSPLEALNKLYQLQQKAEQTLGKRVKEA